MERRELLALGGIGLALSATTALGQDGKADRLAAKVIRIYSTPDGGSRVETLTIAEKVGSVPVTQMTAGVYSGSGATAPDWHTAPRKQFAINMTGELEVELTDGTRQRIGAGDLVFLEDVTGRGHVTRALGPITNLFLHVEPEFDIVRWAQGT